MGGFLNYKFLRKRGPTFWRAHLSPLVSKISLWSNVSQSHYRASSSRLRAVGSWDSANSSDGGWRTPIRSPHRRHHWPGTTFWSAWDNPPPLISSKQSKGCSLLLLQFFRFFQFTTIFLFLFPWDRDITIIFSLF